MVRETEDVGAEVAAVDVEAMVVAATVEAPVDVMATREVGATAVGVGVSRED